MLSFLKEIVIRLASENETVNFLYISLLFFLAFFAADSGARNTAVPVFGYLDRLWSWRGKHWLWGHWCVQSRSVHFLLVYFCMCSLIVCLNYVLGVVHFVNVAIMSSVLNGDLPTMTILAFKMCINQFLCIVFPVKPNIPVYRAKFSEITPQWVFTVTEFLHFNSFCLICAYFVLVLALVMFLTIYLNYNMGLVIGFWHCQYCHLIFSSQNVWE